MAVPGRAVIEWRDPRQERRMRTFLVASSKGGAGKTTLATNLAAHYALDGKRTVLVDADRQHSATRWGEKRAGLAS